ncbi:MAG: hypothetical protein JRI23_33580 [Deltaproteobacteria bacterium]|jgi:hypothetical protein|nr:hypothetical protein [Deltaproteobacteria bacterium]MBW2537213.1 hypothetical protein [Deltaproteobacteria bacterium]
MRTDLPVVAYQDGMARRVRAVDLSCSGALFQRQSTRYPPMIQRVELDLGGEAPVRGVARTVWAQGDLHAVRFVELGDVDRLEIAEHIDRLEGRGCP